MSITVYTSGVFDLLHAGHVEALQRARSQGDELIVGVLSDEDAASYKRQPIIPYEQRRAVVCALSIVDRVIPGPKFESADFYEDLGIDLHCQGNELDGFYEVARSLGILRILGRSEITDTTQIIRRIATGEEAGR